MLLVVLEILACQRAPADSMGVQNDRGGYSGACVAANSHKSAYMYLYNVARWSHEELTHLPLEN